MAIDTSIKSFYWSDFILGKINSHLTDCDSPYEHVRLRSEAILSQEINFAMHLSIHAIVVDLPARSKRIENFARVINQYYQNVHNNTKFILRVEVPGNFKDAEEVYEKFLQFKMLCGHHTGISVILHFQANLPNFEQYTRRWLGEQVFGVQLDTSSFINNSKGFPVLSKAH